MAPGWGGAGDNNWSGGGVKPKAPAMWGGGDSGPPNTGEWGASDAGLKKVSLTTTTTTTSIDPYPLLSLGRLLATFMFFAPIIRSSIV